MCLKQMFTDAFQHINADKDGSILVNKLFEPKSNFNLISPYCTYLGEQNSKQPAIVKKIEKSAKSTHPTVPTL